MLFIHHEEQASAAGLKIPSSMARPDGILPSTPDLVTPEEVSATARSSFRAPSPDFLAPTPDFLVPTP